MLRQWARRQDTRWQKQYGYKIVHPTIDLQQGQVVLFANVEDVVAGDRSDAEPSDPKSLGNLRRLPGRGARIRGSHIGYDFDALRLADLQYGTHPLLKQRIKARRRILHSFLLG